jgi:hypothetical protein
VIARAFVIRARKIHPGVIVQPRHSAHTGLQFNPFFSDLDLTIVVPDLAGAPEIKSLRELHERWRQALPFFSELEIFTTTELARFEANISEAPELFSIVRNIRKLLWLREDEQNATTEYHRYKAVRARNILAMRNGFGSNSPDDMQCIVLIRKLASNLKPVLKELLAGSEAFSLPEVEAVACDHLGWNVQNDLGLLHGDGWTLLAVLPAKGTTEAGEQGLAKLRGIPAVGRMYRIYLETEADQINAVFRAHPEKFPWMEDWSRELRARIS